MPLKSIHSRISHFVGLVLQVLLIAGVACVKEPGANFRFFLAYSVFNLIVASTLYLVHGYRVIYFYAYYGCEGIGLLLGFGVVYEIFGKLLFPYPVLKRVANCVFPAAVALFVLLATVVVYAQSSGEQNKLMAGALIAEEAVRIVELGIVNVLVPVFQCVRIALEAVIIWNYFRLGLVYSGRAHSSDNPNTFRNRGRECIWRCASHCFQYEFGGLDGLSAGAGTCHEQRGNSETGPA